MSVRQFYVDKALVSYASLVDVLAKLTEEEVLVCLDREAGALRRPSVFNRLIARAARLRELDYQRQLKEKYQWHVPRPKSSAPRS